MPIQPISSRLPTAVPDPSVAAPSRRGTPDPRMAPQGLAQAPRPRGTQVEAPRPRMALGAQAVPSRPALPPVSTRPVPAAVDQALQAVLPEIFKGPVAQLPSAQSTAALREGLAVLHDALKVAGQPGDLKPLVAALSDSVRLPDIAAAGTKGAREEAAGVLEALVQTARAAIGPGRDGAALAALYGHSPALDQGVNALRTEAATQFMLAHAARGQGDAAVLPASVREGVRRDAEALTKAEYGIAQTKLQIVRALGSGDGFVPALAGLRFTPELAQGLRHANTESGQQAGVLMGALLSQERSLAESPAGQRMLAAVQSQLRVKQAEAPSSTAARADMRVLTQRAAALQPQPVATGLSTQEQAVMGLTGLPPAQGEALLLALAGKGVSGVGEVQEALAAAGQTLERVKQNRERIDAVDEKYQKSVGVDQGQVLAAGLLRHLAGDAQLPVGPGTGPDERVQAALTGPAGTLAALGVSADAKTPLRQQLQALGNRHDELEKTVRVAQAELVIGSFAAFDAPEDAQARAARQQPLHDLIERSRQGMATVMAERRDLLGPVMADALQDAVRAAALGTHPDLLDITQSDGLADKARKTAGRVGQAVQTDVLAEDPARLHAEAMHKTLAAWGLPAGVVGPEVRQVLAQPIDAARIGQWTAEFHPAEDAKGAWEAAQAGLADRQKPAGAAGLEAAALKRLIEGVGSLQAGTRLSWTLGSKASATTMLLSASFIPVPGLRAGLTAERGTQNGIQVERDAHGYQLVLNGGSGGTASLGMQLGGSIPKLFTAQATASIEGSGHQLTGVALRFPDSDTGRADMQALLQRLLAQGSIAAKDLASASEVMPVVERMAGAGASAGGRLTLDVPVLPVSLAGQNDSVNLMPRAHLGVVAGVQDIDRTRANQHQQVQEHVQSFSVKLPFTGEAKLVLGIESLAGLGQGLGLGKLLPDTPTQVPVPAHTLNKDLVDLNYQVVTRDVREGGQVSGATERVARIKCPPVLADFAVGQVGGPALKAVLGQLQASGQPEDAATLQGVAALIRSARANDEIGVVWRLDPKVQDAANLLLQKARTAANRQGGHANPKEAAAQFEAQAKALLSDPASYVLHGLELVASEKTSADIGKLSDLSALNLGVVKWGKRVEGSHECQTASVVFDAAQVRAARPMEVEMAVLGGRPGA